MKVFLFSIIILFLIPSFSYSQVWRNVTPVLTTPGGSVGINGFYKNNQVLYVAGGFKKAGNIILNSIAMYDSINWTPLGNGINYAGSSWSVLNFNGNITIGGSFTIKNVDSLNIYYIKNLASWNSYEWSSIGNIGYPSSPIRTLTSFNNSLYIGGDFAQIGSSLFSRIAKWDGTNWLSVGGGVGGSLPDVYSMAVYNNELYVGGDIATAGSLSVSNIARWDGTQWHSVGNGLNNIVFALLNDTVENVLYAAGNFSNPLDTGLSFNVARWNGSNWSFLGNGFDSRIDALSMYKGCLYVGGLFTKSADGSQTFNGIARWDGISWHPLDNGTSHNVYALQVYKDELYVGGDFSTVGSLAANSIAKWYVPNDSCLINIAPIQSSSNVQLVIYPNPNSGNVTIEISPVVIHKSLLNIYNSKGELFRKFVISENENMKEINTSKWSKGIYYCTLEQNEKKIAVKKLIVE